MGARAALLAVTSARATGRGVVPGTDLGHRRGGVAVGLPGQGAGVPPQVGMVGHTDASF